MLKALYDYACRHDLALPAGCVKKTVKAWIHLDAQGSFQFVESVDNQKIVAPDIGSLAHGKKSNILVEKRSVVLPDEETPKSRFFLNALWEGSSAVPALAVCAKALEEQETADRIRAALDEGKIKPGDFISFKVEGQSVLDYPGLQEWWGQWRKQFQKPVKGEKVLCLITGEPTTPMTTTTPINGLRSVGGNSSGDALICFDKSAFCSYGLKKAANAPVSEEAFGAVKAGLDKLLETAPTLAGMKFVHWYDAELSEEEDPIKTIPDFGWGFFEEDEEEDALSEQEQRLEQMEKEIQARRNADSVVKSVLSGSREAALGKTHYYILLLTGVNGRIMVRRYERGNYGDLQRNLDQWYQDLLLTNSYGTGCIKPCKLKIRLIRLLKHQKVDKKASRKKLDEQLKEELSGVTPAVLMAILNAAPLPDSVAMRALASIRSEIMGAEDGAESHSAPYAYQWLKVWLMRRERGKGEVELMKDYNWEHSCPAYHFGGMMAVYAAIQRAAMPGVNVNVVQRYYSSAMQTPALVLGQLSHRSVHHLEKMENQWLAGKFTEYLQRLNVAAGDKIPSTLTLPEQSYFALGYYQMGAYMKQQSRARAAEKKDNTAKTEMEG